ncbi:MAG: amidohydrolase [Erysipelotrichaceae bacterium]|nr:amidohydrolase [Erysipelotrichaceae bacterium]MDY6035236.1 amidohydrolase [Bulleidia sp.]
MKKGYINAIIWQSNATAFAIEDQSIIKVGSDQQIQEYLSPEDEMIDLKGQFVLPGFIDSHMHLLELGMYLSNVQLENCKSNNEVKNALLQGLSKLKKGEWLIGRGFLESSFDDQKMPTKEMLDTISDTTPIIIVRACGHVLVANSAALQAAGITKSVENTDGNIDFGSGLVEEIAMRKIYESAPKPTQEKLIQYFLTGAKYANQFGITTVGTDDFLSTYQDYTAVLKALESLAYRQALPVRINEQCEFNHPKEFSKFLDDGYTFDVGDDYFRIGPLKLISDGSLGARTAMLSNAYNDDISTKGKMLMDDETMETFIRLANQFNMPTIVHAIGDGALDHVLSIFKDIVIEGNPLHHGIVHCQIMRPDQIDQVVKQKLACYYQSIFIDHDAQVLEDRVGQTLANTSYPFHTLYQNTLVANGSDAPVEIPDVLKGIQCAVTRKSISSDSSMHASECLSVDEAISTFTTKAAEVLFMDHCIGQIKEGYYADIVVLDKDIRTMSPETIYQAKVKMTIMDGKVVYKDDTQA